MYEILERHVAKDPNTGSTSYYHNNPATCYKFYPNYVSNLLVFLFQIRIIHRDLKPGNILIDSLGHLALADYGLCKHFPSDAKVNLISNLSFAGLTYRTHRLEM